MTHHWNFCDVVLGDLENAYASGFYLTFFCKLSLDYVLEDYYLYFQTIQLRFTEFILSPIRDLDMESFFSLFVYVYVCVCKSEDNLGECYSLGACPFTFGEGIFHCQGTHQVDCADHIVGCKDPPISNLG